MQTSDTSLLFQSDQQLKQSAARQEKARGAATVGQPLQCSSQVLDTVIHGDAMWTAESGWQARYIDLASKKSTRVYRAHQGPVTSITLQQINGRLTLFTGSWDMTIRLWDASTGALLHTLEGHADFVKSIAVLGDRLLSASSDRTLKLWEITPPGAQCCQTIRDHTRPVDAITSRSLDGVIQVWTGDSMGKIKQWILSDGKLSFEKDLASHETSVTSLSLTEDGLWSGSLDKTAVFHPFAGCSAQIVTQGTSITSVLEWDSLLLVGCEDGDVHVWDLAEAPRLVARVQGHCAAVTDIKLWRGTVITSSLDGTCRFWSRADLLKPPNLAPPTETLTEDEEKELAELME